MESNEYRGYTYDLDPDTDAAQPNKDWDMAATFWLTPPTGLINLSDDGAGDDLDPRIHDALEATSYYGFHTIRGAEPAETARLIEKYHPGAVAIEARISGGYRQNDHRGLAYILPAKIRRDWNCQRITAKVRAQVREVLESEVETMNQWANGDIFCYDITAPDGTPVDSLCGLYGEEDAHASAQAAIDCREERRRKEEDAAFAAHWHDRAALATA